MLTLDKAFDLLNQKLTTESLKKHCLASAAIMRALAARFWENGDDWETIGLIHDIDFDETRDTPEKHTVVAAELLAKEGLPSEYIKAIQAHNEATGVKRESRLDHALAAAESITGLIVACAMVLPDRKISSVKASSVKKRMKEKAFARNVSRESIMECEKIGIPIDDFIQLSLQAMSAIEGKLL